MTTWMKKKDDKRICTQAGRSPHQGLLAFVLQELKITELHCFAAPEDVLSAIFCFLRAVYSEKYEYVVINIVLIQL